MDDEVIPGMNKVPEEMAQEILRPEQERETRTDVLDRLLGKTFAVE